MHPAQPPFRFGAGCPNKWVLQAGSDGLQITGFQTNNASKVGTPKDVDDTLLNMLVNSDGSFLEIYEDRFWEIQNTNNGQLPSGKTLAQWAEEFHTRRRSLFPNISDPFPKVHRHTFKKTSSSNKQTFYYYDPISCGAGKPVFGTIIVK